MPATSPQLGEGGASPSAHGASERVIDVSSDSPALLRGGSDRSVPEERDAQESSDVSDSESASTATELEVSEHQYQRGRHAIPMQSPGDEPRITRAARRRSQLPSLRKRRFFDDDGDGSGFQGGPQRGRILQRIIFRRRKRGEDDGFWTGIFLSNVLSLFLMIFLSFYLMQTDFFESHQNDLFGTTVDERFTVVSPESSDAKITLKSGYSTAKYSEAMIAFGNGELKVGRRALSPTDTQSFYGISIANNGSATFTNKVNAPFVKTDYLHTAKALVFQDGTAMTTAANLTGGLSEVGDLNLVSKTGSITFSTGRKPVVAISHDAAVTILDTASDDPQGTGIVFQAATGDVSIAGSFRIHHDDDATSIGSTNPIQLNTSQVVIGTINATKAVLTCPPQSQGADSKSAWSIKPMILEVAGQSAPSALHGGDVVLKGGDGKSSGGSVIIEGGASTNTSADSAAIARSNVFINAKLGRKASSITEIGSGGSGHQVNIHGSILVNGVIDSSQNTTFSVSGEATTIRSKNITLDNQGTNTSRVAVRSNTVTMEVPSGSSLLLDTTTASLVGEESLFLHAKSYRNDSKHAASVSMDAVGVVEVSASKSISFKAVGANASTSFFGPVLIGVDDANRDANGTTGTPDLVVDNGSVTIDADTFTVGAAGTTADIAFRAERVHVGDSKLKSNVTIAGDRARVTSKLIHVGSSGSRVTMAGKAIELRGDEKVFIGGENGTEVSIDGDVITLSGDTLRIGDKDSDEITLGDSTSGISIGGDSVSVGVAAKNVNIGGKPSTVKIGSADSTVELHGKVMLNGKPLESRRQLESERTALFAIAGSEHLAAILDPSKTSISTQIAVKYSSQTDFVEAVDSSVRLGRGFRTSHIHLGLSLENVRVQASHPQPSKRLPKLRCKIVNAADPSSTLLQVVVPLEVCDDVDDCNTGVFLGGSSHKVVAAKPGARFEVWCDTSVSSGTLLVDRVQLDILSLV